MQYLIFGRLSISEFMVILVCEINKAQLIEHIFVNSQLT